MFIDDKNKEMSAPVSQKLGGNFGPSKIHCIKSLIKIHTKSKCSNPMQFLSYFTGHNFSR